MRLNVITFPDGGWLRELYKDGCQVSMRVFMPGESSGGSIHRKADEKWWVAMGTAVVILQYPDVGYVAQRFTGPSEIIDVPAGTGHKLVNVGVSPVVLLWHSSKEYDPDKPDKEPWEDPFPGSVE